MAKYLLLSKRQEPVNPEGIQRQPDAEQIERLAHQDRLERDSPIGTAGCFRATEEIRLQWQQLWHEGSD